MRRRSTCNRLPGRSRPLPAHPTIPAFIDSALIPSRGSLTGAAAVRQLAEDFRQASFREGGVNRDDLALLGWSAGQLAELAAPATLLARKLEGAAL